jgi:hypothetical protein
MSRRDDLTWFVGVGFVDVNTFVESERAPVVDHPPHPEAGEQEDGDRAGSAQVQFHLMDWSAGTQL